MRNKVITVNQIIKDLQDLVKEDARNGELPLIYSIDPEGNGYNKVFQNPCLVQVEDINQYNLEIVGFIGEETINEKDCNAVIIN